MAGSTKKYCEEIFGYRRRKTHEVMVGDVGIGGNNPIRVQSMTIADTMDTAASVKEARQLVEAGCEIVRLTAPSIKEAENLRNIRDALRAEGIRAPLVADIHYTPNAALVAADFVEKVRINPGNYADKKKFEVREYTDREYEEELERIEQKFAPLVKKCKANGIAMRIGVNHGSLSDRVMNRYGDTPEGMVQSALEFIRICESHGYRDIVVSMKSSNPQVMIQAYRLFAARMAELGMTYPFHVGVTEAGDGEDGRIKSAVGIGALLEDGIGDTIRVSLTEDSVYEIPVAQALVRKFNSVASDQLSVNRDQLSVISEQYSVISNPQRASRISHPASNIQALIEAWTHRVNPFEYRRRFSLRVQIPGYPFGAKEAVRVGIALNNGHSLSANEILAIAPQRSNGLTILGKTSANGAYVERMDIGEETVFEHVSHELEKNKNWLPLGTHHANNGNRPAIILFEMSSRDDENQHGRMKQVITQAKRSGVAGEFLFHASKNERRDFHDVDELLQVACDEDFWNWSIGIVLGCRVVGEVGAARELVAYLDSHGATMPITLHYNVIAGDVDWHTDAASQLGALLCDGVGDAVVIGGAITTAAALRFSYNLLQATRLRISKTEFISCPSCGRTLFNLQTTTERIKAKTSHLKGVKIAIMGCIVNGPGEMADADFGYVGSGPQKVNLFVGKECVERNVPEAEADVRLIELIKKHNKWVEPEGVEQFV